MKNWLEALAFKVWMAPEDIPGVSNYAEAIPKGIENCKVLVLILSERRRNPSGSEEKWKALSSGKSL